MKYINLLLIVFLSKITYSQSTPNLAWAYSFGSTNVDQCDGLVSDNQGNTLSCGRFAGTVDFDNGVGTYTATATSQSNSYILKTNALGNFVWMKHLSGNLSSNARAITLDNLGNIYITGTFNGTLDFDPSPTASYNLMSNNNTNDVFVLKLDSNGDFVWATKVGGTGAEVASSISVDSNQNVYYAGSFVGTVDFDPGASVNSLTTIGTIKDYFISKLNSTGNFVWAKQIRPSTNNHTIKIQNDINDNLVIAGAFSGTVDFDPGTNIYNLISSGNNGANLFILNLNSNGNFSWAKSVAGYIETIIPSNYISLDDAGNIYSTGRFTGTVDFDPSSSTYTVASSGSISNVNSFILKLNVNGDFVWVKTIGGSGIGGQGLVNSNAISVNNGKLFISGYFRSTLDFDLTASTYTIASSSNMTSDSYIAKYDTTGNLDYAIAMSSYIKVNTLHSDINGHLLLAGNHNGTNDFDPSSTVFNMTSLGADDCFIYKLSDNLSTGINIAQKINSTIVCFPNPASKSIQIQGINFNETASIKIISVDGKLIQELKTISSTIDISELSTGMYFIELRNKAGEIGVAKFIKE